MTRWALVLGGSSGMGLATAEKLGRHGWNLIIIHRDRRSVLEGLHAKFEKIRSHGVRLEAFNFDGTNNERIAEYLPVFSKLLGNQKINLMVHSISRGNLKSFFSENEPELSDQDIHLTFDSMALNMLTWTRVLLRGGFFSKPGKIVSLTSQGNKRFWKGYGAIAIAKASLEALTKYLAIELAPFEIRVNTIQGGVTDTPSLRMIPGAEKMMDLVSSNHPLGRMTRTEDIANVIYLLSLDEANWINGSVIQVDGGENLV